MLTTSSNFQVTLHLRKRSTYAKAPQPHYVIFPMHALIIFVLILHCNMYTIRYFYIYIYLSYIFIIFLTLLANYFTKIYKYNFEYKKNKKFSL